MDERLRFVARLLEGEKMATLCREFDVSRKTGYKIFQRYKEGTDTVNDGSGGPDYASGYCRPTLSCSLIIKYIEA